MNVPIPPLYRRSCPRSLAHAMSTQAEKAMKLKFKMEVVSLDLKFGFMSIDGKDMVFKDCKGKLKW